MSITAPPAAPLPPPAPAQHPRAAGDTQGGRLLRHSARGKRQAGLGGPAASRGRPTEHKAALGEGPSPPLNLYTESGFDFFFLFKLSKRTNSPLSTELSAVTLFKLSMVITLSAMVSSQANPRAGTRTRGSSAGAAAATEGRARRAPRPRGASAHGSLRASVHRSYGTRLTEPD